MAHTTDLPAASLASIATQIAERRPPILAMHGAPGAPRRITESFPIWMLGADDLGTSGQRLRDVARDTKTWHHQINQGDQAREVARSVPAPAPGNADGMKLVEFGTSPLASKIGETLVWIDQHSTGDPMVRLLAIPAYFVLTFWLEQADKDEIVLVDRPPTFDALQYREIYDYDLFRMRLRDMPRPQGLPPGPPPEPRNRLPG